MRTGVLTLIGVLVGHLIARDWQSRMTRADLELLLPRLANTRPPTTAELNSKILEDR